MRGHAFNLTVDYIIKWCICAIVFAAPFSKSISEIAIVIAITAWAAKKITDRDLAFKHTDLNIPLLILVVTILPSFFNTGFPLLSLKALFSKVLKYVFLYFVITESMSTKSKMKDFFIIAVLSMFVVLIDGIAQQYCSVDPLHNYPAFKARPVFDSGGFFRGFPTACFPFPNDFAAWILLTIFPVACAVLFDLRKYRVRYCAALLSFGLLYMLVLTKTRAAWLGFGVSTVYLALAKKKTWLILLLIIALAVPYVLKMEMVHYIFQAASVNDRVGMWDVGWKIFKAHPIVGNGLNTFFLRFMECRTDQWRGIKGSYAHNCYLQMAGDVGIVGLLGFLIVIAVYFLSVIRNMRRVTDPLFKSVLTGMSVGIFAFLVLAFFDTNLYSLNLVTLFWCAIGISQAIIKVSRDEAA